ncbi:hypothetical protein CYY_008842 [Polysphondylium violaceum]|uniref:THO complex subunit 5 n=1 Tax=Polysphondylium violaceum TaxID=133409 RepID=A0A8J4PL28_9MYCE|nr:hypothetical protein CYY_008842 [Polysphondylium violaceum]
MTSLTEKQQQCFQLIQSIKNGLEQELEQNNLSTTKKSQEQYNYLFELMFQLKNSYNLLENTLDKEFLSRVDSIKELINIKMNQLDSYRYEKSIIESEIDNLAKTRFDIDSPSLSIKPINDFISLLSPTQKVEYDSLSNENKVIFRLEWEIYQRELKLKQLSNLKQKKIEYKQLKQKADKDLKQFEDKLKNTIDTEQIGKPLQKFIHKLPTTGPIPIDAQSNLIDSSKPIYILYNELFYFQQFFESTLNMEILSMNNNQDNSSNNNEPHNIYISVKLNNSNNNNILELEFYYYPKLKIITVLSKLNGNVENGLALLERIDQLDQGLMTPNLSNHYILDNCGNESFNLSRQNLLGRPFKWAQYISGLSFLPDTNTLASKQFKPKTSHQVFTDIINLLNLL